MRYNSSSSSLWPGTHHLDGRDALTLARTRHNTCNPADNDLTRVKRQQEILNAINRSKKRQAELIITTQKDAVRFPKLDRRDLPIYFVRVEIKILSGAKDFQDCVSKICFR